MDTSHDAIEAALAALAAGERDVVCLLRGLADSIRPRRADDIPTATANFRCMIDLLRSRDEYRRAARDAILELFGNRKSVSLFSDAGILPATEYAAELIRRLAHRVLPEVPDPSYLKDALAVIFHRPDDHIWLENVPLVNRQAFWASLEVSRAADRTNLRKVLESMLDAALLLGYRVAAAGGEPELRRVNIRMDDYASPFMGVGAEAHRFVEQYRRSLLDPDVPPEDEKQLLVIIDQCEKVLEKARDTAAKSGTSLRLTFLLVRLKQSLERLRLLAMILGTRFHGAPEPVLAKSWTEFIHHTLAGIIRRNSVSDIFGRLTGLLALRVTDNAGKTGEHYIAADMAEYKQMWRSAAGAGLIIGVMALLKIFAHELNIAPAQQAFLYAMNYGLGFMLVHVLHFTIATKQPAMTAATLAREFSAAAGRQANLDHLVTLIANTGRSQLAAILGNVTVALSMALLVGFAYSLWNGHPPVSTGEAEHLLADLDPIRSGAVFYAGIAGVYLFLAGLISGWVDNWVMYSRFRERFAAVGWTHALLGEDEAARAATWLEANLGGLTGNFLFGIMLGVTGTIGYMLGLPLDIRHIAFAAANVGYAVVGMNFAISWQLLAWSALGVALIGLTNLTVSFGLALWVALKSRGVTFSNKQRLLFRLFARFLRRPGEFILPPRRAK